MVKDLANEIKSLDKESIASLEINGELKLEINDREVKISSEDVEIISTEIEGWIVETEEGVTVAIDTDLTDDLLAEGYAREFVNRVQNMRKDAGYDVVDRINIFTELPDTLRQAVDVESDYICNETLADTISGKLIRTDVIQKWKIDGQTATIAIERVLK